MLTSIRGLSAATLSAGALFCTAPAFAAEASDEAAISEDLIAASAALDHTPTKDETVLTTMVEAETVSASAVRAGEPVDAAVASDLGGEGGVEISANVAFTTEYRFRGVDLSGGEFAVQGGFDVSVPGGFYVGTWASNLDEDTVGFGSTELDVYGGWSGDLTDGIGIDVGMIAYLYPDAGPGDFDYIEFYGSVSGEFGPASVTAGIAYAPDQDSLGSTDNLYLYTDLGVGIPGTPLTVTGHLGYTDGFLTFTDNSKALDWSIGAETAVGPLTLSAAYVGVESDELVDPGKVFTDDAFVLTVSASF
ncbi:MAG: TorF family putative porin [Pseudomonadota bacterium]